MLESGEVGQLILEVLLEPHSGENCSGILSCSAESPRSAGRVWRPSLPLKPATSGVNSASRKLLTCMLGWGRRVALGWGPEKSVILCFVLWWFWFSFILIGRKLRGGFYKCAFLKFRLNCLKIIIWSQNREKRQPMLLDAAKGPGYIYTAALCVFRHGWNSVLGLPRLCEVERNVVTFSKGPHTNAWGSSVS